MKKKKKFKNHPPQVKIVLVVKLVQAVEVQAEAAMMILKFQGKNQRNYKRKLVQMMRKGWGRRN